MAGGLTAASLLGLLGLYQGFGYTWRYYPPLREFASGVTAPPTPAASPAAPPASADDPTASAQPQSRPSNPDVDPLDAAAPMQVADATPARATPVVAEGADIHAPPLIDLPSISDKPQTPPSRDDSTATNPDKPE